MDLMSVLLCAVVADKNVDVARHNVERKATETATLEPYFRSAERSIWEQPRQMPLELGAGAGAAAAGAAGAADARVPLVEPQEQREQLDNGKAAAAAGRRAGRRYGSVRNRWLRCRPC